MHGAIDIEPPKFEGWLCACYDLWSCLHTAINVQLYLVHVVLALPSLHPSTFFENTVYIGFVCDVVSIAHLVHTNHPCSDPQQMYVNRLWSISVHVL